MVEYAGYYLLPETTDCVHDEWETVMMSAVSMMMKLPAVMSMMGEINDAVS